MKAARFYNVGEPLRIDDIPIPDIEDTEVLVQMKATGLCGTDIHILYEGITQTRFTPITLGHEPAGTVARIGKSIEGWQVGERVSVLPGLYCRQCGACLQGRGELCEKRRMLGIQADGALAEYLHVPAGNLVRLPDNVSFAAGAILTDAVATPYHALIDQAALRSGESIAIFGAGGLGLHAIQIARMAGAQRVIAIDIRAEQLKQAQKAGADVTIDASSVEPVTAILDATEGRGVNVAAEFIGLPTTIAQAVEALAMGGRAVVSGLGPAPISILPPDIFVRKEFSLIGSYAFTRQTIERVVSLVASGRLGLEASITHRFTLDKVNEALTVLREKTGNPTRIVITFD